jgi:hypothetical protein
MISGAGRKPAASWNILRFQRLAGSPARNRAKYRGVIPESPLWPDYYLIPNGYAADFPLEQGNK